jgi:imidazole glycerol phosphate synthase glutamine amidotransferase subunit
MNLGILDYGGGNLRSVINAFAAIGHEASLVTAPGQFDGLDLLVFPGQGAFGDSVRQLTASGLWQPLQDWLRMERPYLGICLGYQLLFESGEESPGVAGLCRFRGTVPRFPARPGLKIPHMGWNTARFTDPAHPAWQGLGGSSTFYFVHSYFPQPDDPALAACVTDYSGEFVSGIASTNLIAVQFHPEKSQGAGLKLLSNAVACLSRN